MLFDDRVLLTRLINKGVKLTGRLNGWSTTKDLILHLAGKLTVRVRRSSVLRDLFISNFPRAVLAESWNISDPEF